MAGKERVRISDYPLGGQLLLWATRHWVKAYRRGWMMPACVWQSFAAADLDKAYAELCRLLGIVAFRELNLRAISSPSAARLSAVERQLMTNFERVERYGRAADLETLGTQATPAIKREMLAAIVVIVAELARRGHRIARVAAESTEHVAPQLASRELAWLH